MEKIIVLLQVVLKVKSRGLHIKHGTGHRMYSLSGHPSILLEELLKSFPYFPFSPFEFSWNVVQKQWPTYVNKKIDRSSEDILYPHSPLSCLLVDSA